MDKPGSEIEFVRGVEQCVLQGEQLPWETWTRLFALARRGAEMQWRPMPTGWIKQWPHENERSRVERYEVVGNVLCRSPGPAQHFDFYIPISALPPPPAGETE